MPRIGLFFVLIVVGPGASVLHADDRAVDVTYEQHVRPLLRKHCAGCHQEENLEDEAVAAHLALDTYEATIAGVQAGVPHKVVVPDKSGESLLLKMLLEEDEDLRMPLDAEPLSEAEIDLIRRWIDQGAKQGEPSAGAPEAPRRRRALRTLDVLLPVAARPPADLLPEVKERNLQLIARIGPLAPVTALSYRPDGKQLWVGRYGKLSVWDPAAGTVSNVLAASNSDLAAAVHDIAFSPGGGLVAVAGGLPARKGQILLINPVSLEVQRAIDAHRDIVFAVAFTPDGKRLASCSFDKTVKVWEVVGAEGKVAGAEGDKSSPLYTFDAHSDFVYGVAFSPDGNMLASASKDRTLKIFDMTNGKGLRTLSGHNDDVLVVAFDPDGKHVISAGHEPQLRWWKLDDGSVARRVGGHGGPVHHLQVSRDGKFLVSASADKTLRLWDAGSGALKQTFSGSDEWMYAAALSPDGKHLVGGSWDGLVRVWDVGGSKLRATLLEPPARISTNPEYLTVTPEGYYVASVGMRELINLRLGDRPVESSAAVTALENGDMIGRALSGQAVEVARLPE